MEDKIGTPTVNRNAVCAATTRDTRELASRHVRPAQADLHLCW